MAKDVRHAVIIQPAEAQWDAIQEIRKQHDKAYVRWMPHINLLYPFVPESDEVVSKLKKAVKDIKPFSISLNQFSFFTHSPRSCTLFSDPNPVEPIVQLQAALESAFPDCNDLSVRGDGKFVPHLTLGQFTSVEKTNAKIEEIKKTWKDISVEVTAVHIIARTGDSPFKIVHSISLGPEVSPVKEIRAKMPITTIDESESVSKIIDALKNIPANTRALAFVDMQLVAKSGAGSHLRNILLNAITPPGLFVCAISPTTKKSMIRCNICERPVGKWESQQSTQTILAVQGDFASLVRKTLDQNLSSLPHFSLPDQMSSFLSFFGLRDESDSMRNELSASQSRAMPSHEEDLHVVVERVKQWMKKVGSLPSSKEKLKNATHPLRLMRNTVDPCVVLQRIYDENKLKFCGPCKKFALTPAAYVRAPPAREEDEVEKLAARTIEWLCQVTRTPASVKALLVQIECFSTTKEMSFEEVWRDLITEGVIIEGETISYNLSLIPEPEKPKTARTQVSRDSDVSRDNASRDRDGYGERDRDSYVSRDRDASDRDRNSYASRDRDSYGERDRDSYASRDRDGYGDRDSYVSRDRDASDRDRNSYASRDRDGYGERDSYPSRDRDTSERDREAYPSRSRDGYGERDRESYDDRRREPYGDRNDDDRRRERYGDRNDRRDRDSDGESSERAPPARDNSAYENARKKEITDFDKIVAKSAKQAKPRPIDNFDDMRLSEDVLRGIYSFGFEKPSLIQKRVIPALSKPGDVVIQSHSGTGKTAAYCIPMLNRLEKDAKVQAIILVPSRELAQHVHRVVIELGDFVPVTSHCVVGGTSVRDDIRALDKGVQVVVGTCGRVLDMINRNTLNVTSTTMLFLDEGDELIKTDADALRDIVERLPPKCSIALISSTFNKHTSDVWSKFLTEPLLFLEPRKQLMLEGIQKKYINVEKEQYKLDCLADLYETLTISQAIVFCNTKRKVDWLADKLRERDLTVSSSHGDIGQRERDVILNEFRCGSSRVLITTSQLSRGLDIHGVDTIINYDLPPDHTEYYHRVGRCGRFGRQGLCISFITEDDEIKKKEIEEFFSFSMAQY